ncbi:ABC transporter permease [Flavobacterium sp. NKUCC04_CG]|uniref:ABC transporter permease n=1 Tax=Flavobacterium sp. NKUCC04_CG TaxID=2842121 RepID=UPI001C5BB4E1|nr:ABC transporter permease [Flavobacterium sp. NKUCC04_CG]MBW3518993.1 ABC transporter permease [Flavobacterium sp. NKUCC04_CG]
MSDKSISNNQLALQKFKSDFWGVLSFWFVVVLSVISIFAYVIVPDKTQNANAGDLSLRSKAPGFTVTTLALPSEKPLEYNWQSWFVGRKDQPTVIPISNYYFTKDSIHYTSYSNHPLTAEKKALALTSFVDQKPNNIIKDNIDQKYFILGTDNQGRDFLSRLVIGSRVSLAIGFVAVTLSLIIGVSLGALAGYYGGKIDALIMWIVNMVWSIPTLLLVIAITLALGKGFWQVFIAVGLTMWVEVARVVRGQVISVKEQQYVTAARALGYNDLRIILRHVLPNCMAPVIVISAANFASAILVESGLSFLGLGAQVPVPSWGSMIKENYNYILLGKPYLAMIPGIAMFLLVMAFMLIGNTLRDALDVKK